MSDVWAIAAAVILLAAQHYLSSRPKAYWGALLPAGTALFLMMGKGFRIFNEEISNGKFLFLSMLAIVILLGIWAEGRKRAAEKIKKELEKMEIQNL